MDKTKLIDKIFANEEYRAEFNNSPHFSAAIEAIQHGADELHIIYQLSKTIDELRAALTESKMREMPRRYFD